MSHRDPAHRTPDEVAVEAVAEGSVISIWVVPGASRSGIVGPHDRALKIRVAAPAERGRANDEALAVLGRALDSPVELLAGDRGRRKRVLVIGRDPAWVSRALADLGRPGGVRG